MSGKKLIDLIDQHVPGLFFIIFTFAAIELGILVICAGYSGNQHILKIYNPESELIYEDVYDESHINEFKAISGISNFREEGYVLAREAVDNKFPTRAWIALSISVPLVLVLFVAFIVKVFTDVFHAKKESKKEGGKHTLYADFEETKFEKVFSTLGRLNIYSLGATVILMAFLFWVVPDVLQYLGAASLHTISEFKWIFLGAIAFAAAFIVFKAWLSYKTKNEIIRQQAEIQKHRDRLVIEAKADQKLLGANPARIGSSQVNSKGLH